MISWTICKQGTRFVEQNKEVLIRRAYREGEIIKELLQEGVLSSKQHDSIMAESTNQKRMQKLYELVPMWDVTAKYCLYKLRRSLERGQAFRRKGGPQAHLHAFVLGMDRRHLYGSYCSTAAGTSSGGCKEHMRKTYSWAELPGYLIHEVSSELLSIVTSFAEPHHLLHTASHPSRNTLPKARLAWALHFFLLYTGQGPGSNRALQALLALQMSKDLDSSCLLTSLMH
ncbi:uncharacterized protein LOC110391096 isoform X2 [Numida meleagris]|uniref:uncharacterized protein LOC110391096 isoform X2 n=1 Tax=Numida meleagris TaxID=8996 RepID=UPI000B3E25FB|nr:uncharacterized protein LOC110391096 isoform X2 [Numida meleagris]